MLIKSSSGIWSIIMSTPRDLMAATYERWKQLVFLNGTLEDYVLFTVAIVGSFACGVAVGYYLL